MRGAQAHPPAARWRVTHPNLVAIHDAGEEKGAVFIAMEFIDGQTLREWLRTKRPERALTKVGDGLRDPRRGAGAPRLQARQRAG
ncbi:MAG: hypothetical protein ACOZQL_37910 [Myxococcota bacterium]